METGKALELKFSTEISDDIWCEKGDEFLIDDFFDIPTEEICNNNNKNSNENNNNNNNNNNENNNNHENEKGGVFLEDEYYDEEEFNNYYGITGGGLTDDSDNFTTQLAIPEDDMQELELWSQLMDDSGPEPSLTFPKPSTDVHCKKTGFAVANRVVASTKPCFGRASFFPMPVPVKPRSKRSRLANSRSWSSARSPPITESSSSSSSPSPSPLSPVSTVLFAPLVHEIGMLYAKGKPPVKKLKKKQTSSTNGVTGLNSSVQRRCCHCQVTKTPQWRAGPNGPKTLCNACGVRFKSGRLFPEYRPACSPTFSSEEHSNSHRKVLEMRLNKESAGST